MEPVFAAAITFFAGGMAGAAGLWLLRGGTAAVASVPDGAPASHGVHASADKHPQPVISQAAREELEEKLRGRYEAEIEAASRNLSQELAVTSKSLMEQVSRLTAKVIEAELEGYQQTLEEMRMAAAQTVEDIHQTVEDQRAELRAQMREEVKAERERLVAQFDTRLGDIVASYVTESLGGGVDLGAQMSYITSALEERREDIKKDLLGAA